MLTAFEVNFELCPSLSSLLLVCIVTAGGDARRGGGSNPNGRAAPMFGGSRELLAAGGEASAGDVRLPNRSDSPDDNGKPESAPDESSELSRPAPSAARPGLSPSCPIGNVLVPMPPSLSSEEDSVSLLTLSREENLLFGRESKLFFLRTGCFLGGVGIDGSGKGIVANRLLEEGNGGISSSSDEDSVSLLALSRERNLLLGRFSVTFFSFFSGIMGRDGSGSDIEDRKFGSGSGTSTDTAGDFAELLVGALGEDFGSTKAHASRRSSQNINSMLYAHTRQPHA